jgi:recombinational DNA repair protein (RecF pathway)
LATRICTKCGRELPETEEYFKIGSNSSQKKYFHSICKECQYGKKICEQCGKEFIPNVHNQKRCSQGCMEKARKVNKDTKICSKCKKEKDASEFYIYNPYRCKECVREYQNARNKKDSKNTSKNFKEASKKNKVASKNFKEASKILESKDISLNGLNGDLKAIELYKGLSHKICLLMRKNRIEKYGINTQNIILDLMNACCKHLQKELKEKVIIAEWE